MRVQKRKKMIINAVTIKRTLQQHTHPQTISTEQNALFELVAQAMQEQAFDELRTKEQLGYIVFSGVRRSCGTQVGGVCGTISKEDCSLEATSS